MCSCSGSGVCLDHVHPGGFSSPDTPTPLGSLGPNVVNPECVPCSGFIFVASANHRAQICVAGFAEFEIELIAQLSIGTLRGVGAEPPFDHYSVPNDLARQAGQFIRIIGVAFLAGFLGQSK